MKKRTFFILLMVFAVLAGCGDSNKESSFDATADAHPEGWVPSGHAVSASADIHGCTACHGQRYEGGISDVKCVTCHMGSEAEVHPLDWEDLAYSRHDDFVAAAGTGRCENPSCHGTALGGVPESGPSCTSCHLGGLNAVHPVNWGDFAYSRHDSYVSVLGNTSCANHACHGTDLRGAEESGPSCTSCHMGGVDSAHPPDWNEDIYHRHREELNPPFGTDPCANAACHGEDLQGVPESGPGCFTLSICHG